MCTGSKNHSRNRSPGVVVTGSRPAQKRNRWALASVGRRLSHGTWRRPVFVGTLTLNSVTLEEGLIKLSTSCKISGLQMRAAVRFAGAESPANRWGIILAGGDGTRLLSLSRKISGDDRPKQFCPILSSETLLRQTQRRVLRLIKPRQMLLVLTRKHEHFYSDQVSDLASTSLVIQSQNRGTAPAYPL